MQKDEGKAKPHTWVAVLERYGRNRIVYIPDEDTKKDAEERKVACVMFRNRTIDVQAFRRHMTIWQEITDDGGHPGLVAPLGFVDRPNQQNVVLPFFSKSLSHIVTDCDREKALDIMYELCDVLNYLHLKRQCHGDLALDHVFLEDGHVRLPWYPHLQRRVYEKTRQWVAPEEDHVVRPESDVFQLAYIFFCLLERRAPPVDQVQFSKCNNEQERSLMYMICNMANPDAEHRPTIRTVQDLVAALRVPRAPTPVIATLTHQQIV